MPEILHLFFPNLKKQTKKTSYIQKYWGKKQGTFLIVEVGFHFSSFEFHLLEQP